VDDSKKSGPRLVRDLMSVGVRTCSLETPITDLARLFLDEELEAVVVLDENGHAAGVVSQTELVHAYAHGNHIPGTDQPSLSAEEIMEPSVLQVPPDIPLSAAAQILLDRRARAVFMMHHAGGIEYPAAILTFKHILRHIAMRDPSELSDLGIKANRKAPLDQFLKRREEARRRANWGG
jgi:CBS domain-containing protein